MHSKQALYLGYVSLIFAQISIGVNVIIGKYLLDFMPIFLLLGVRFFFTCMPLGLIFVGMKGKILAPTHPQGRMQKEDWWRLFLQGLTAGLLFNLFFLWGMRYTTATSAGIISSTLPAIVAILAFFFLKERLSKRQVSAIFLAMIGIVILGGNNHDHSSQVGVGSYLGDFLIFLAMIPEAIYSIIGKSMIQRVTALGSALIVTTFCFLTILPFALWGATQMDWSQFSLWQGGLLILSGLITIIFYWCWMFGLSSVPVSTAGLFGGVMPISTALLAVVILGEKFTQFDLLGMLCVLGSLLLGTHFSLHAKIKNGLFTAKKNVSNL